MRKHHQPQRPTKVCLMENRITVGEELRKYFYETGLNLLSSVPQRRIQEMILAMAQKGHSGKMTDCGELGAGHRTTYGHFLSKGKWDHAKVEAIQRQKSYLTILSVAEKANQPVYLSIDDTVVPKKKPSVVQRVLWREQAGIIPIWKAKRYMAIKYMLPLPAQAAAHCATVCAVAAQSTERKWI